MTSISLSRRDINVLEKIKDPESDPSSGVQVDASLPKDPQLQDQSVYDRVSRRERDIVLRMQQLEQQLAGIRPRTATDIPAEYRDCVASLDGLIADHPTYASARNNRAQALRRLYGDFILVEDAPSPTALLQAVDDTEKRQVGTKLLSDLDSSISLLTPTTPRAGLSPQAAKTLSMAHTQRAAIYHMTSKLLSTSPLAVEAHRREATWTKLEFEEAASRDFALGGRYGNEIAKGLAVSTNPTAKLCGQMVREAMNKEYGVPWP
ncbi:hypothetical protein GQ53DRAFT_741735 [Thozetella sp. PMI_491]|nr:hypothetical protein GQ53DRAFT_741735 [Thozetella sp. PMI_491]